MTELLEKAFAEAAKLPEQEQDSFASWLLEELASYREAAAITDLDASEVAEIQVALVGELRGRPWKSDDLP
jgi:hypothetical protein